MGAYHPRAAAFIRGALVSSIKRFLLGLADVRIKPAALLPSDAATFILLGKAPITWEVIVIIIGKTDTFWGGELQHGKVGSQILRNIPTVGRGGGA